VWWLGVHGGAGETTLAQLLERSSAAEHAWPVVRSADAASPRVVLVARTHAAGLRAAQAAAIDWAAGDVPVRLLGLALIADAPGRLPRVLRDLAKLVAGGYPDVWSVGWHEPWRLGEPPSADSLPAGADALLTAVCDLTPDTRAPDRGEPGGAACLPVLQPHRRGAAGA
jgi:hypothetical protein